MKNQESWGIIGGGIMGMTLALRLSQKGYKVTIFESSSNPGGLASAVEMDGIKWDKFYHVILMSDLNTRRIIKEIGLEKELKWMETKTGFFTNGNLYSMSNILEFLKFPPLNLLDKFRLGLTILAVSLIKDWKKIENIPVDKWLIRWSGNRVFKNIWLPLLKAKLGDNYKITSAAFIWNTIQRMYAARKTGLKKEMFGYVSGGYDKIIKCYVNYIKSLGVQFVLNSQIKDVTRDTSKGLVLTDKSGFKYQYDFIISTLPSDISVNIAPSLKSYEVEKHKAIKYLGVVCPSILLKKPVSEFYVTNITDSWPPFTGIIEMTALVDPRETGNRHLVYLPRYVNPDDELFTMSSEEMKKYFLEPLYRMYPFLSEDDITCFTVASARRVFALPTLGYSEKLPSITTSLSGYYIVNNAQIINGTLNVNETLQVAEKKLEEIVTSLES
jgi:protoporphyrinogen oxidase